MSADNNIQPDLLAKGYAVYTSGEYLKSVVLLLFRLSMGYIIYLSGYRHLHVVDDMVSNFQDWGVPFPRLSVYVSGITELFGGALLMLGFATRLVSVPLAFNFLVAILTAGKDKVRQALFGGDFFKRYYAGHLGGLEAVVNDDAFPLLVTSLLTLSLGAGKVSVDYLIHLLWYRPRVIRQMAIPIGQAPDRRPMDG